MEWKSIPTDTQLDPIKWKDVPKSSATTLQMCFFFFLGWGGGDVDTGYKLKKRPIGLLSRIITKYRQFGNH